MHTQHARGTTRTLTPLTKAKHETKRTDADRAPQSLCTVHATEITIIIPYMAQILFVLPYVWRAPGNITIISNLNVACCFLCIL